MSIRKRTWKTPSGEVKEAWIADYFDASGHRRNKNFKLKKDAEAFITRAKLEVNSGTHTPASISPTVADAAKEWLADRKAAGLERSTLRQYAQHVTLHIEPLIGNVKLSKLTTPAVIKFRNRLQAEGRSPELTRKILTSLGSIFVAAKEQGLFNGANPVQELGRGRRQAEKRAKGQLQVGVDIPTPQEIARLVAAIPQDASPVLLVAAFCGLRASELRALNWASVDLVKREVHVRQRADRWGTVGKPKSAAGERSVPIPPQLLMRLRLWKLKCPKSELGLVFPSARGRVLNHKSVERNFLDPALIAAGVTDGEGKPRYGLHSLRHWFASWCANSETDGGRGLPLKKLQALMGHASMTITADTYSHLFPRGDDADELAAAEQRILGDK